MADRIGAVPNRSPKSTFGNGLDIRTNDGGGLSIGEIVPIFIPLSKEMIGHIDSLDVVKMDTQENFRLWIDTPFKPIFIKGDQGLCGRKEYFLRRENCYIEIKPQLRRS